MYFSYEGECGVHILRHLKEVLAWGVVKYFWFSNNGILLKTVVPLSYQRIKAFKLKIILYTLLCCP